MYNIKEAKMQSMINKSRVGGGASALASRSVGFTLAEVLIILAVIGVVAALTIPTLVNNYQKHLIAIRLKQAYALFSNVLQRSEVENGAASTWKLAQEELQANNPFAPVFRQTYIEPFLKDIKYKKYYYSENWKSDIKNAAGANLTFCGPDAKGVPCLNNGMCFWLCKNGDTTKTAYIYLIVDLDGPGGEDRVGRDIFAFNINFAGSYYSGSGLLSFNTVYGLNVDDASEDRLLQNCNSTDANWSNGFTCSALIKRNNWKIPEQYPW